MMSLYTDFLQTEANTWLVTGVAGFIGSHVLELLLENNQYVIGLDNLSTGTLQNLDQVKSTVGMVKWKNFTFYTGDIRDKELCNELANGCEYVVHLAAVASVSKSIECPELTHEINVTGFLNVLLACRESRSFKRLVFASSSAVYGNNETLPLHESEIPNPLTPYAASKLCNEIYANAFFQTYGLQSVGFRYFNVYGERQDPNGPYAAVIPNWIEKFFKGEPIYVDGDGLQSRDFVYVRDVAEVNVAGCLAPAHALKRVYNVGTGASVNLLELFQSIREKVSDRGLIGANLSPIHRDPRLGDIKHSRSDIGALQTLAAVEKFHSFSAGLDRLLDWFTCRSEGHVLDEDIRTSSIAVTQPLDRAGSNLDS